MANDSLIYLEVKRQEKMCQRVVSTTDFKGIYLLDARREKAIEREIEATDVSIFKDLSVRNAWIYKNLRQLIITNIQRLQRAHCIDTTYQNQQYAQLHSRINYQDIQPFKINGRFILPLGESIFSF